MVERYATQTAAKSGFFFPKINTAIGINILHTTYVRTLVEVNTDYLGSLERQTINAFRFIPWHQLLLCPVVCDNVLSGTLLSV